MAFEFFMFAKIFRKTIKMTFKKILKRLEKLLKLNYNKEKGDIECNRKI